MPTDDRAALVAALDKLIKAYAPGAWGLHGVEHTITRFIDDLERLDRRADDIDDDYTSPH